MLQFFRNFFKSKVGIVVTLAFLALIALAFASSDIANTGTFGGVSGGDRVAVVGDTKIGTAELAMNVTNAMDQVRQEDPRMTMQAFISQGGVEEVLAQMLSRTAIAEFGRESGIRAGDRLVDSEILQIPSFRGADGKFDRNAFLAVLSQRGLTESTVRDDLAQGLIARQVVTPVTLAPQVPQSVARRYASLLQESRKGSIGLLPSEVFAPEGDPTDEQLQAYYRDNSDKYIRPERRVIRFASFGAEALGNLPEPTEAQIKARFESEKAQYAAVERRSFTQVVTATEAAAREIVDAVKSGTALAAVARNKGLATADIGPMTRNALATASSSAVAQAGFAADKGEIAEPKRGGLGWYVLRVDNIDRQPARTLGQVRGEIAERLAAEQRRQAIADLSVSIEDEFDGGGNMTEVASEIGAELKTTKPVTADGRVYQSPTGETIPEVLTRVLQVAFDMEEGEPQLAEVVPGETFVIYEVSDITPSATAPLKDIRDRAIADWRRDQGQQKARAAADRVLKRIGEGKTLAQAISEEKLDLPPPAPVDLDRRELARQGQVPPPLALMFSMAEGTVKKLEGPEEAGWYVVQLDDVEAGTVADGDPIIAATVRQLSQVAGDEYAQQFVGAIERQVKIERNQVAIDAVVASLAPQAD